MENKSFFVWWFEKKFSNLPNKTNRKMNLVTKNMCCMMPETSAECAIVQYLNLKINNKTSANAEVFF